MIQVNFENNIAEQVVAALERQIADLGKISHTCANAKQMEAVKSIKQDIAQLHTLKDEIEQKAGLGAPKLELSGKKK